MGGAGAGVGAAGGSGARGQDFRWVYDWLRGELSRRIDGYGGGYPWWGYYRPWPRQRPKAGREQVRLRLSLPRERVLLHEASAWLCVMNNWHLPLDREEGERILLWDGAVGNPRPADLALEIERSWVRMFELDELYRTDVWKPAEIHANFEELRLEDVVEARVGLW